MKIAFLVGPFPSLSESFILKQITGLIDRGHSVDIYAFVRGDTSKMHAEVETYHLLERTYYRPQMSGSRTYRRVKGLGLLCVNFWKAPIILLRSLNIFKYGEQANSLRLFYSVIPFLPRQSYDVVHCHFATLGLFGVLLRDIGALQGKLVTSFHGRDVNKSPNPFGPDSYRWLFQRGDLYTANTTFTANKAIALGCPRDKIVKLPEGMDITKFPFHERKPRDGQPVNIITVARLVEKKGIEYSIKAVAKVAQEHPNIKYQIAGDGHLRDSLQDLIGKLGVSDKVQLLGWKTHDELCELYRNAQIFVLSSVTASDGDQEGQGLVLQEAQGAGLCVLSTLHNGIPDGVLDGKSGFLVPERDVDALAEKLRYLIAHPEIWPEMGRAGRAYVEERYDIIKLTDCLVEIYTQLVSSTLSIHAA